MLSKTRLGRGLPFAVALVALTAVARAQAAPVTVIAEINAKIGEEAKLKAGLLTLAAASRGEPGSLSYTLLENPAKPGQFFTYEVWADQAAIDAHLKGPAIGAAMSTMQATLGAPPVITMLKPVS